MAQSLEYRRRTSAQAMRTLLRLSGARDDVDANTAAEAIALQLLAGEEAMELLSTIRAHLLAGDTRPVVWDGIVERINELVAL